MKQNILSLLITGVIVACLAACGNDPVADLNSSENETSQETIPEGDDQPLTIETLGGNGSICLVCKAEDEYAKEESDVKLLYSCDGHVWKDYVIGTPISTSKGSRIYFKAGSIKEAGVTNSRLYGSYNYINLVSDVDISVSGNLLSLLYGDHPGRLLKTEGWKEFYGFFKDCVHLHSAAKLLLSTNVSSHTYCETFMDCKSLVDAPQLPAMALTSGCYMNMFTGCSSLVHAPELPATSLSDWCYSYMFMNCTSLVEAPQLPATSLSACCYQGMFSNCTSLTKAPVLPATSLAENCYSCMFGNCTHLTDAPQLPATQLAKWCYSGMFLNCYSLKEGPALVADDATVIMAYSNMFENCNSLSRLEMLATKVNTDGLYCFLYTAGTYSIPVLYVAKGMANNKYIKENVNPRWKIVEKD